MNKKVCVISFVSIFLISIFALNLASASPVDDLISFGRGVVNTLTPLAESILGTGPVGQMNDTEISYLFARVLFLLIMFAISWSIVSKLSFFSAHDWMIVIVSGAVSILSTRFLLQPEWLNVILIPYSALGIAMTSLIPMIIYLYFVESIGLKTIRKIMWVVGAVIFFSLWLSRYELLKGIGTIAFWIYPVCAIACLVFLWFDGTLRFYIEKISMEKQLRGADLVRYDKIMDKLDDAKKARLRFDYGSTQYTELTKEIKELEEKAVELLAGTSKGKLTSL